MLKDLFPVACLNLSGIIALKHTNFGWLYGIITADHYSAAFLGGQQFQGSSGRGHCAKTISAFHSFGIDSMQSCPTHNANDSTHSYGNGTHSYGNGTHSYGNGTHSYGKSIHSHANQYAHGNTFAAHNCGFVHHIR